MNAILLFIAISYSLSVLLATAVALTGGHESPIAGFGFTAMFIPAIAVLFLTFSMREGIRVRWRRFDARYLLVALFLMPGVLHAVMLPVMALLEGELPWLDWLTPGPDGLYHTPPERGWGVLTTYGLAGRIAVNAIVGLIVVSILAFFEEVGWRAWLLPRLTQRLGAQRAVVATATIWALWHVPFQLSGIQHVDGISPVQLALVAPLGMLAAGLIIGWLWLRTESICLVSIAHGALNNWGQYAFKYMREPAEPNLSGQVAGDLLVLGAGFLALLSVGVVVLCLGQPPRRYSQNDG